MSDEHDPTSEIGFEGDEEMPKEFREHLFDAVAHHAGHGKHPGKYKGSPHHIREDEDQLDRPAPTPVDLARLREEMEGDEEPPKGPTPPAEALPPQPPLRGGDKGKGEKPPSGGTPVEIGQKTVAPPPPGGEF
jgi:hypothetical protein